MGIEDEKKPYEPTQEEIEKAEGMMDRLQNSVSLMREYDIEEFGSTKEERADLIEKMKSGEIQLKLEQDRRNGKLHLYGKIGEHQIDIEKDGIDRRGSIDNERISPEYAKEIYDKYSRVGMLQQSEPSFYTRTAKLDIDLADKYEREKKENNAREEEGKRALKEDQEKYKL